MSKEKKFKIGHKIKVLESCHVILADYQGTDVKICDKARKCTGSKNRTDAQNKELLRWLFVERATSSFEFCNVEFSLRLPLFVVQQLLRHRTGKFQQQSLRYGSQNLGFFTPPEWRIGGQENKQKSAKDEGGTLDQTEITEVYEEVCESIQELYAEFIKKGVCFEQSRFLIPQGFITDLELQLDLNNLMKLLSLRMEENAQEEMIEVAEAMFVIFKNLFPWTAELFEKKHPHLFKKKIDKNK
jgi:thymidylate synthase (FAD)